MAASNQSGVFGAVMKSTVVKHSIVISGRKTSISLETSFWGCLRDIAHERVMTLSQLVTAINSSRTQTNLSSAIRVFVLEHFRYQIACLRGPNRAEACVPIQGAAQLHATQAAALEMNQAFALPE